MQEQLDRIENIVLQLDRIENIVTEILDRMTAERDSPFDRDDDAPPQFVPVPGTELVLGPRPKDATELSLWREKAKDISSVTTKIPEEISDGVLKFVAATGFVPPAFVVYQGGDYVVLRTGVRALWIKPFSNFLGDNVNGVIRAYKGPNVA